MLLIESLYGSFVQTHSMTVGFDSLHEDAWQSNKTKKIIIINQYETGFHTYCYNFRQQNMSFHVQKLIGYKLHNLLNDIIYIFLF